MSLYTRFRALCIAHPDWPAPYALRVAAQAHRAAQAALAATQTHPDAFALIDAHLAAREQQAAQPQMPLLLKEPSRESMGIV